MKFFSMPCAVFLNQTWIPRVVFMTRTLRSNASIISSMISASLAVSKSNTR